MGSMRQLASMFRHVHEAQAMGVAEDISEDALAPGDADAFHVGRDDENEAAGRAFQQN